MIQSLQSLRIVFALFIFLHHYPLGDSVVFRAGGSAGVSFFLLLSGFVMSAGYDSKFLSPDFNFKTYILKRIIRLWPLHLLALTFAIALYYSDNTFSVVQIPIFIIDALMLQAWVPTGTVFFSGNAVSWCLSVLIFCYAIMPFVYRRISNTSERTLIRITLLLMCAYAVVALGVIPAYLAKPLLYISPIFRFFDFYLGIVAYRIYCNIVRGEVTARSSSKGYRCRTTLEFVSIMTLGAAIYLYYLVPTSVYASMLWWIPMLSIVLIFSLSERNGGGYFCRLLQRKSIVQLSSISFTFYILHKLIIDIISQYDISDVTGFNFCLILPGIVVLTFLISYCVFKYFENPISQYFKKKFI